MLFQSPPFVLFVVGLVLLLLVFTERSQRHTLLLLSSYLFYSAWDIRFLSLIIVSTAVDFFVGRRLHSVSDAARRKQWLALSVVTNLGILGVFKYFDFFARSAVDLAAVFGVELSTTTLQVVLPVGISFYTFQSMSYTIDIYRGVLKPEPSLKRFALYVAFFPQLVAGPIVRARDFLPQLSEDSPPRKQNLPPGLFLFAVGLFKKTVIADQMAMVVDPVFAAPERFGSGALLFSALAYAFQIYCDFSGYSDMAIGLGRILGYRLPRNFDQPYSARTPREFWQRWHISLSTWLRDYLYIPLGGSRCGTVRTYVNLMVTMLLGGLWHGANWTFVAWGGVHGAALTADRATRDLSGGRSPRGGSGSETRKGNVLTWLATMSLVLLGWVLFRCQSIGQAVDFVVRVFQMTSGPESPEIWTVALLGLLMTIAALGQTSVGARLVRRCGGWNGAWIMLLSGLIVGLAYSISPGENRAFIYFQF